MDTKTPTQKASTAIDGLKMCEFNYGNLKLVHPKIYYQFLKEQFIFDVYQTDLLKEGDLVLDLGANIGAFAVLASKIVGKDGKVIAVEPNSADYGMLVQNIQRNNCQNITPVNLGVGKGVEKKEANFMGRTFTCKLDTLDSILDDLGIHTRINFIKVDIEGYEVDVISKSITIFKDADVISIECHNTKEEIDKLLLPHGFSFKPLRMSYIYKKVCRNLLLHPLHSFKATTDTVVKNPRLLFKVARGYDIHRDHEENRSSDRFHTAVGSYVKSVK